MMLAALNLEIPLALGAPWVQAAPTWEGIARGAGRAARGSQGGGGVLAGRGGQAASPPRTRWVS